MSRFDDKIPDDNGKKDVRTLSSITLLDKKIKSNNYQFLCANILINILVLFLF